MESSTFQLRWDDDGRMGATGAVVSEEVICGLDGTHSTSYPIISGVSIADTDQIAAENLIYLAQDIVSHMPYAGAGEVAGAGPDADGEVECVTEEVITDDWVQPGGQERVEVAFEQLVSPTLEMKQEYDVDVPLPTDQDEYTAMRPYPCDFCSRRFRKKASLMNHMVAHQNDRPHGCNLCGMRYVRKSDLMNHLKTHAFVPQDNEPDYDDYLEVRKKKERKKRKRAAPKVEENGVWENMTSARTQQWSRRSAPAAPLPPPPALSPTPPPALSPTPSPPSPPPPPADPRRPFVCRTCGVGFAREKALQSHSRVHGGDSPLECGTCGELCWSREALTAHTRSRHPNLSASARPREPSPYKASDTSSYEEEMEYSRPQMEDCDWQLSAAERAEGANLAPELFCQDCGVAFQRADLLRRHVVAAHSYKRHDSETMASDVSGAEHACDVCGESCTDALQLLAHAEGHARDSNSRIKRNTNAGKQFPCYECGKVFGSRSSQQIHVRIHTGERPYGCRFCWKAFADGGTLRKHERIHTGEKPYACAVCPRAFNQRVVLREHVRSHHSAPDQRRSGSFCCSVCACTLTSSSELVQHLIEHCDANTALRRQPQTGPRKYKRRRRIKQESETREEPAEDWPASPAPPEREPSPSPSPSPPPPPRRVKRRARRPAPPPRPKMIHTEEVSKPRTKNVRSAATTSQRLPPAVFPLLSTEPADDLRAILPQLKQECDDGKVKREPESGDEDGIFRCEMCSLVFRHRNDLLLHVPVHI